MNLLSVGFGVAMFVCGVIAARHILLNEAEDLVRKAAVEAATETSRETSRAEVRALGVVLFRRIDQMDHDIHKMKKELDEALCLGECLDEALSQAVEEETSRN